MLKVLVTGFGPFPGVPFNPTGDLVRALGRRHAAPGTRRLAHVFETSYAAVDGELPVLMRQHRPAVILMFGVCAGTKRLRIEMCARNALSSAHEDASGHVPVATHIEKMGPAVLSLRAPARRLLAAARASGLAAERSHDAGMYLCNYLCWRARRIAGGLHPSPILAFVHVPLVRPTRIVSRRRPFAATLGDLVEAGEALLRALIQEASRRNR